MVRQVHPLSQLRLRLLGWPNLQVRRTDCQRQEPPSGPLRKVVVLECETNRHLRCIIGARSPDARVLGRSSLQADNGQEQAREAEVGQEVPAMCNADNHQEGSRGSFLAEVGTR